MIISDNIKINKVENLSTEYIENELKKVGIEPIRWAITKVEENTITITLSYERE